MSNNEPMSAILHLVGAMLSIAALVLMIVFAAKKATAWHVVGFSIFGTALILLYSASTIYHFNPNKRKLFLKIDHSMIYVLIAATYTPICLVIRGGLGWSLFGIIWGIAIIGILLKILAMDKIKDWVSVVLYILMGWLIVIVAKPIVGAFDISAFIWLALGGVLYTLGTIFYVLDRIVARSRWFGMHEIFHIFVLAGSFCHFWLMFRYVINY